MAKNNNIEYPKNAVLTGVMSFPLYSEDDLAALTEWRTERNIKRPKFADKIGGTLLITEKTLERVADHLEKVYLPFVNVLYKETDGAKGIEPDLVKGLIAKVKKRDWSDKDTPIRDLTPKDIENNGGDDSPFVAKFKFMGPYQSDIKKSAIVLDADGRQEVTSLRDLIEDEVLTDSWAETDRLWWGSGAHMRVSARFNAYDTANVGISAYVNTVYLLPDRGLPTFGGNSDAEVIEDGDDDFYED